VPAVFHTEKMYQEPVDFARGYLPCLGRLKGRGPARAGRPPGLECFAVLPCMGGRGVIDCPREADAGP
jgi:hypothetical protein